MGLGRIIQKSGAASIAVAGDLGGGAILFWRVIKYLLLGRFDKKETIKCMYSMGYKSLSIMIATSFVVGVILVIQAFVFVDRYGMRSQLGWGAGFVTIRELGPVLLALMFSGRVGAYTTAELGTMKVTEQIDGLRCLAIDPLSYLIVPRFIAMILSLTFLTLIGNGVALVSASIMGKAMMQVEIHTFWSSLFDMLKVSDMVLSVSKSAMFGGIIAITSCYFGFATKGGAPGVGISVNRTVVSAAVAIFVVDFFSTFAIG